MMTSYDNKLVEEEQRMGTLFSIFWVHQLPMVGMHALWTLLGSNQDGQIWAAISVME